MAQKETKMVIKVNLACEKCRKKIKKILCDIPQIQNQVYDEKENTVTITVAGGNLDEIKKKICWKGGKIVKGIEILKPPAEKLPPPQPLKVEVVVKLPKDCPKGCRSPPRCLRPPKCPSPSWCPSPPRCLPPPPPRCLPPPPPKCLPPPPPKCPPPCPPPVCCRECGEGGGVGPCWEGCGRPSGPCCYGGYGRPVYDSWGAGCNRGYYPCRCTDHICEQDPGVCTIM